MYYLYTVHITSFFDRNKNNNKKKKKSGWNTSVEQSMNIAIKIQITLIS